MTTTWTQGAKLAPEENVMRSPDLAEFVRRYGTDDEAVQRVLDCAQEVDEAWRARQSARMTAALEAQVPALEAMRRTPRRAP